MQLNLTITLVLSLRANFIGLRVVTKSRSFCSSGKKRISDLSPNLNYLVTMKCVYILVMPLELYSVITERMVLSLSETLVLKSS